MRSIAILALLAAPLNAQSFDPDNLQEGRGPNAKTTQQPMGPNAQVAHRAPAGPNTELIQASQPADGQVNYPTCAAAGAVRALPIRRGEPGYDRRLDRDDDGIACEQPPGPSERNDGAE